jgi:hypothetical protein
MTNTRMKDYFDLDVLMQDAGIRRQSCAARSKRRSSGARQRFRQPYQRV